MPDGGPPIQGGKADSRARPICLGLILVSLLGLLAAAPRSAAQAQHVVAAGASSSTPATAHGRGCSKGCTGVVYLGNGCFWERQWAYYNVEISPRAPFRRKPDDTTSLVGYAGGKAPSGEGEVCYHTGDGRDYGALGHAEAVLVHLDPSNATLAAEQLASLAIDFFRSFTGPAGARGRPDAGDMGSPYRSMVGLPGGMSSPLYAALVKHNAFKMALKPGTGGAGAGGGDGDEFNTVWVYDSEVWPFYSGEVYHQYHCNFFMSEGMPYPDEYTLDLWKHMQAEKKIAPTGCPEDVMPHDSCSGGLFSLFG
jgi:peptide methionine sulfoxide reductase MsrA